MIKIASAGVCGLAVGVAVMLGVSASVDSRTARETQLEQQVALLGAELDQSRANRVQDAAKAKADVAAIQQTHEAEIAEKSKALEAATRAADQAAEQVRRTNDQPTRLDFSIKDVLAAVGREYAIAGATRKDQFGVPHAGYAIANGKVLLQPSLTTDGALQGLILIGNPDDAKELARTFFLILQAVRPYKREDTSKLELWFGKSMAFVRFAVSDCCVRRSFDGMSVTVSALVIDNIDFLLVAFDHDD